MIVVLMGVTSSGKTTVGRLLAERLGAVFAEGDSYHPEANVAKMRSGKPLEDADRWPWLEAIAADMRRWLAEGRDAVVTCSALKRAYRSILCSAGDDVHIVHLTGDPTLIRTRMEGRVGHYMPVTLLPSQLSTLEPPADEEQVLTFDVRQTPEAIVEGILATLARRRRGQG
jgi:gluconokinase